MVKYAMLLVVLMMICAGGIYEHMTDVIFLCMAGASFFVFKIWQRQTRKNRRSSYFQKADA